MQPSDVLELTALRAVAGGRMLARHEGRVVLVGGAIPGERVRARVDRVERRMAWASTLEPLVASADRREPACDPACGGSLFAHIRYDRQIQLKREIIEDAFRRVGKLTLTAPLSVAASPETGYRVRARLHVQRGRAGFFREGTHALCDAGATGQLHADAMPAVDALLGALGDRAAACEAVVIAENVRADERLLHLEARRGARFDDLQLPDGLPFVTGVTTIHHGRVAALSGRTTVSDTARDVFGDDSPIGLAASWTRGAASFFQGNRFLIGALVRRVLDEARGDECVDLYSGVGLFAVALAARGSRVTAVEGDSASGVDLAANAAPWSERLRVVHASVEVVVARLPERAPDVVIVDPPRVGVSAEALAALADWRAPRIVYVSCDPPTLARDAARLCEAGYELVGIDAFDLFPNTPHVEAVAVFDSIRGVGP